MGTGKQTLNRCPLCGKPEDTGRIIKTWDIPEGKRYCCSDCVSRMDIDKVLPEEIEVVDFYA
jgi:hypothetical protein